MIQNITKYPICNHHNDCNTNSTFVGIQDISEAISLVVGEEIDWNNPLTNFILYGDVENHQVNLSLENSQINLQNPTDTRYDVDSISLWPKSLGFIKNSHIEISLDAFKSLNLKSHNHEYWVKKKISKKVAKKNKKNVEIEISYNSDSDYIYESDNSMNGNTEEDSDNSEEENEKKRRKNIYKKKNSLK